MRKIFITTLIYFITSFSALGKVDGKGLICKCIECELENIPNVSYFENRKKISEIGFFFNNNKVKHYYINKKNDKISLLEKSEQLNYHSDIDKIKWEDGKTYKIYWVLDRKTLLLERTNTTNRKVTSKTLRKCSGHNSFKDFKKVMNQLILKYQTNYETKLKKNKF